MNLVSIYQGFADENRLRIIHLLAHGPLGVKHLQGILGISQVRVSKHLAYLRQRGIVEVDRNRNWMLYRLPVDPAPELRSHLKCLSECARGGALFEADLIARQAVESEVERVRRLPRRMKLPPDMAIETSHAPPESVSAVGLGPYGESDYVD